MAAPTAVVSRLKKCAEERNLYEGISIHSGLLKQNMIIDNIFIANALISMYAKCGALATAQQVFDALPARDVVTWTSLIAAHAQAGQGKEALNHFERLKCEGVSPDSVTLSSAIKACGYAGALKKGKEIHAEIVGECLLGRDDVLGNALVDMYAKCGALTYAQELFDKLLNRNVVSWTALIGGYCQHGHYEEALAYFERMQSEGLSPNAMTFSCILKACGSIGAIEQGKQLHLQIVREGLLKDNIVIGTALLNMYIMCGAVEKAQEVFDALGVQDIVSWTALIAGYCRHGHDEKAIDSFDQMQKEGLYVDLRTLGTILRACGSIGAIEKGRKVHAEIVKKGSFGRDVVLGTAMVDMYAKWGFVAKAQQLFDELPVQVVASWTALIAGYGQAGKHCALFESFNKLIEQGIELDKVLFSIVLKACQNLGLVDEGRTFFETLSASYCMIPTLQDYTGLVSLFGRAGHLEKAMDVMQKLPFSNLSPAWFALLDACRKWGELRLGELAFGHSIKSHKRLAGEWACTCMIDIYGAAGMPQATKAIEAMIRENEIYMKPGS